jgi:hypothetical protein
MERVMSLSDIEREFGAEWVLLVEPETDNSLRILKGKVAYHSKDRDEVYRKAVALKPKRSAIIYTGSIPQGSEIIV